MAFANVRQESIIWADEAGDGSLESTARGCQLSVHPPEEKKGDFSWIIREVTENGVEVLDAGTARSLNGAKIKTVETLNKVLRAAYKANRKAEAEAKELEAEIASQRKAEEEEKAAA
jgi:hypothetical protein